MNNSDAEEEEILVYAEFDENVNIGKYRSIHALGVDSDNPVVQMDDTFFTGKFESPVGTYMFFEEDPAPQCNDSLFAKIPGKPMKFVYKTSKVLKMEHAFVTPKGDRVQDLDSETQKTKEDYDAISFSSIQEGIECFRECLNQHKKQKQDYYIEIDPEVVNPGEIDSNICIEGNEKKLSAA